MIDYINSTADLAIYNGVARMLILGITTNSPKILLRARYETVVDNIRIFSDGAGFKWKLQSFTDNETITLNADGSIAVAAGTYIKEFIVNPTGNLAAFRAGITPGGNELLDDTAVNANEDLPIGIAAKYFRVAGTLYFTGITSQTEILIPKIVL